MKVKFYREKVLETKHWFFYFYNMFPYFNAQRKRDGRVYLPFWS